MRNPSIVLLLASVGLSITFGAEGAQRTVPPAGGRSDAGILWSIHARFEQLKLDQFVKIKSVRRRPIKLEFSFECSQACEITDANQPKWGKVFLVISNIAAVRVRDIEGSSVASALNIALIDGRFARIPCGSCDSTGSSSSSRVIEMGSSNVDGTRSQTMGGNTGNSSSSRLIEIENSNVDGNRGKVTGSIGSQGRVRSKPSPPSGEPDTEAGRLAMGRVEDALIAYFQAAGGRPAVLDRTESHLQITAEGLRDIILKDQGLWEKVTVLIYFNPTSRDRNLYSLNVVADGFYTAGIGSSPPSASYNHSMEPRYFKQLDEFGRQLTTRIEDIIRAR